MSSIIVQSGTSLTICQECASSDVEIHVQSGATLTYHVIITSSLQKNIRLFLEGEGARASVTCAYLLNKNQQLTINTRQEHRAPRSESSVVLRGVLTDHASVVHKGTVFVPKNIKGVCARQNSKVILLSPDSTVDSSPELEVLNQNVQCSHGSSVGQLDKEQLLYLCSRGLPEKHAKRLLLEAFFDTRKIKKGCERIITKLREMV